jgi:hypothetical protein
VTTRFLPVPLAFHAVQFCFGAKQKSSFHPFIYQPLALFGWPDNLNPFIYQPLALFGWPDNPPSDDQIPACSARALDELHGLATDPDRPLHLANHARGVPASAGVGNLAMSPGVQEPQAMNPKMSEKIICILTDSPPDREDETNRFYFHRSHLAPRSTSRPAHGAFTFQNLRTPRREPHPEREPSRSRTETRHPFTR